MIHVVDAKFIKSAQSIKDSLSEGMSEIVFLGRSNVGKSSIINSLCERKDLAKKSNTPGKTRLINYFEVTYKAESEVYPCRFVDLPGFGYAKVSKAERNQWQQNLTEFLENRLSIRLYIHLIDCRHPNLEIDQDVRGFLQELKRPDQDIVEIFTKTDKLNQKERSKILREFPGALMVSNTKKSGIERVKSLLLHKIYGYRSDRTA
jgi:GTP-binding protein